MRGVCGVVNSQNFIPPVSINHWPLAGQTSPPLSKENEGRETSYISYGQRGSQCIAKRFFGFLQQHSTQVTSLQAAFKTDLPSSVYISLVSCLTISQAGHRPGANPVPRKKLRPRPHEARALSRELPFTAVRRQLTPTLTAEIFKRALTFANSAEQISPQRVEYDRGGVERTCSVTGQITEHHMWVDGSFHHPPDSLFLVLQDTTTTTN